MLFHNLVELCGGLFRLGAELGAVEKRFALPFDDEAIVAVGVEELFDLLALVRFLDEDNLDGEEFFHTENAPVAVQEPLHENEQTGCSDGE